MASLKYKGQDIGGGGGQDATVNGVNDLTVVAGENITLGQEGSTLYIDAFGAVPVLTVTIYPVSAGVTVTATHGATTRTGTTDADGYVEINVPELGTWEVSATIEGELESESVVVEGNGTFLVNLGYPPVYGVQWDGSASTVLARTDDAALFADPVAAVGTGEGSSPFDSIYPWSEMEEYNVIDGEIAYKRGRDAEFSRTDYDTVVYIPEFYYQRPDANTFKICGSPMRGFEKHPGSGLYVSKYLSSSDPTSKSGLAIGRNATIGSAREDATGKGSGWRLLDIKAINAIQMLYLVEFASWDSQAKIGSGKTTEDFLATGGTDAMIYHTGRSSTAAANQVQYRHIEDLWSNCAYAVDGLYANSFAASVCDSPDDYGTISAYQSAGVSIPNPGATDACIKSVSFSSDYPWLILPASYTVNSSYNTYLCDYTYNLSTGNVPAIGYRYVSGYGKRCGLFSTCCTMKIDGASSGVSHRLMFDPETT